MIILGIETSCDETAAAVVQKHKDRIQILSNVVASSSSLQAKYGGIIPEQAAREQIKSIIPVIQESLQVAGYSGQDIDALAVTYGPGLIGSLLVGVETAKTLAKVWHKPLIPINHLLGHFYANWIDGKGSTTLTQYSLSDPPLAESRSVPTFPCLGLLVSGGHTDLVLFKDHGKYEYLGGTRDDAAGECFDKCARLLNLPYPGGPHLSKLAQKGDPIKFKLPIPMTGSGDFDFSYSGLKTSVSNIVYRLSENHKRLTINDKQNLAAAIEETIVKSLINKVMQALKIYPVEQIMIAGGVAANKKLKDDLRFTIKDLRLDVKLHIPSPELCTDNATMIASAAFFINPVKDVFKVQADPSLAL